jgi:ribosomal protein S18 acetylase RimI-like enzyme
MNEKQLTQAHRLAETYIGQHYFSEEELQTAISAENSFWVFAVQTTEESMEYKNPEDLTETDKIIGFIWGRVIPVKAFKDTRFSLPNLYADHKIIFEVPTWVVDETYQEQSVGKALIGQMTDIIIEAEVYPVISPIRKTESQPNQHLFFLSQYGEQIEVVPESPSNVICSVCGTENCSCQTVILQYTEDDILTLHNDCTR